MTRAAREAELRDAMARLWPYSLKHHLYGVPFCVRCCGCPLCLQHAEKETSDA